MSEMETKAEKQDGSSFNSTFINHGFDANDDMVT